jgi:hypothetical protein
VPHMRLAGYATYCATVTLPFRSMCVNVTAKQASCADLRCWWTLWCRMANGRESEIGEQTPQVTHQTDFVLSCNDQWYHRYRFLFNETQANEEGGED